MHDIGQDRAAVGNSDSGLLLNRDQCENGRWLIVERDPAESLKSMLAIGEYKTLGKLDPYAAAKVIGQMADELKYITNERPCMVVKFNDLDDEQVIRLAWEWLVCDVEPWCDWHWREMRHMRVVVRPETYTEI